MGDYMGCVIREGLYFGESPRWHEGRLWYSDLYDHAVHALVPGGEDERVAVVDAQPCGLGWMPDGSLLIVSMLDRCLLRLGRDGTLSEHADLSTLVSFPCNDMVVDSGGQAYVGNFGFDIFARARGAVIEPTPTAMVKVDPDGVADIVSVGMAFPNGALITPDGRTLIVAESIGRRLTAFDISTDGSLSDRRVWADLRPRGVLPDGICLDATGAVWVANPLGPTAIRVAEGGEILDTATFSQACVACMLGGEDGTELFALTAPSAEPATATSFPRARVESARVAVPHRGLP